MGPFHFAISEFDDDEWGGSEGNSNGKLEWGEKIEIEVTVFNDGKTEIDKATLKLNCDNALVSIEGESVKLSKIGTANKNSAKANFVISLASGYQGEYDIPLSLELSAIEGKKIVGKWMQALLITVSASAPVFLGDVYSYQPFDKETMIEYFVIDAENTAAQERLLFDIEVAYKDAMSMLLLDEEE